jgi:hypothetical protein
MDVLTEDGIGKTQIDEIRAERRDIRIPQVIAHLAFAAGGRGNRRKNGHGNLLGLEK